MEKSTTLIARAEDTMKVQAQLLGLLPELEKGKKFDVTIQEHRNKRSLNANNYFHLLVNKIAEVIKIGNDECKAKMNLEYGTPAIDSKGNKVIIKLPSSVDIKQFYHYAKWIGEKEENGLKLSYYLFYKETHTLDTKEMSRLIDGVIYEAQQLNIETISNSEKERLLSLWKNS